MNGQADLDALLRRVNCYRNASRVRSDAQACIVQVRTLRPKIERLIHNNGMESELLSLDGTVAINYQGRQYNIPVQIYVPEPYPEAPPRCYVRPTPEMAIKAGHRHVDREGLIYLPYLHEWGARTHNLTELCGAMSSVFGIDPPVYAVRKPPTPAAGGQPPQPQPSPLSTSSSQSGGVGMMAYPGQQPMQRPPPAYETVAGAGRPLSGSAGYGTAAQQQAQAEVRRREAVQQVLSKTQRSLQDFYAKVRAELTEEQEREARLQERRRDVAASTEKLRRMKEQLEGRVKEYTEKDGQLEAWLKEQGDKPKVHVDDMVEALDPPSRQMLELVAQNAAIEDALYHMDKALASGALDLPTFLKKVRELARDQFLCVAHVNKIYRAQQAALVAARAPSSSSVASIAAPVAPPGGTFHGPVSYPVVPSHSR